MKESVMKLFQMKLLVAVCVALVLFSGKLFADDNRPIVIIDVNDVSFNGPSVRNESFDKVKLVERLAKHLNEANIFRVLTKESIVNSIRDREIFNVLTGQDDSFTLPNVPSYKIKMSVLQYSSDEKQHRTSRRKKHTFKKTSVWESLVTTRTTTVEIMFNVFDIKSGVLILGEKFTSVKKDSETNSSFSGRKGSESGHSGEIMNDEVYYQGAIQDVMSLFSEKLKDIQPYYILDCTDEGVLTLDASDTIVSSGDVLDVFTLGPTRYSKNSGQRVRSERKVAVVRVTSSNINGSTGVFEEIYDADCDWHVILRRRKK
jgi:hypothetical protein